MKEVANVKRGLSFGFSTVNAGQRNVVIEPQVIATSTDGSFRITPVISKLLGIESGDNIAFVSNIDNIDAAIRDKNEDIVAFCEENGLEFGTPEALVAIHKAFDSWAVYKGIQQFDSKGNPKTCTERLTKKDRMRFVMANFDSMLEAAMQSGNEELVSALSRDGISQDEVAELLCPFVQARELPKFSGSKTANPAGLTGVGTTLTFTDGNVWRQLKADLGDEATKLNRVYTIIAKPFPEGSIVDINVNNGYEDVAVKALLLTDYEDVKPARNEDKLNESAE